MRTFSYNNPITRDPALALRDHFIMKAGSQWFMTGTSMPVWSGANPGVRLLVSDDLLNWRHHKWLIDASKLTDSVNGPTRMEQVLSFGGKPDTQ